MGVVVEVIDMGDGLVGCNGGGYGVVVSYWFLIEWGLVIFSRG